MVTLGVTVVAVLISIVGNFINAVGYIVEKKAHRKVVASNLLLPSHKQKAWFKSKLWLFGFAIYASGSLLHAASLAFGPQSLLTPLESVTLVSNTYLAHKYLKEPLRARDIIATVLIVIGASLAVIFGPRSSNEDITIQDLMYRYTLIPFVIFICILSFMAIATYIMVKIFERKNNLQKRLEKRFQAHEEMRKKIAKMIEDIQENANVQNVINPEIISNEENIQSIENNDEMLVRGLQPQEIEEEEEKIPISAKEEMPDLTKEMYFGETFLMIAYTSIGAYFGSCNVLLMKSVAEIVASTFNSSENAINNWTNFITYLLCVLFVMANIGLEYWKQKALSLFGALFVVPIYQVLVIVGGILFGAIYFEELNRMSRLYLVVFFMAIVMTLIGVAILASKTEYKINRLAKIVRRKVCFFCIVNCLYDGLFYRY